MAKRTNHTIGLDIGTSKVTCIVGGLGEEGLLQILGIGEAEARGLRKGLMPRSRQSSEPSRKQSG